MAYWWVNQNQTHHLEHAEGYLWAPLKDKAGHPNKHWELMELVEPGDLIFSYVNAKISKIAIAQTKTTPADRPEGRSFNPWKMHGRRIEAAYIDLPIPLSNPLLQEKMGHHLMGSGIDRPLTSKGSGKQAYFFSLQPEVGRKLLELSGLEGDEDFACICKTGLDATRKSQYWALQGNPKYYNISAAIEALEYDWWRIGNSDVQSGDKIVFWKSKDRQKQRGVVALGVAVGMPQYRTAEDNPYWLGSIDALQEEQRRVLVRYIRIPAPLWISNPDLSPLLEQLTVSRGQGTVFNVTEDQWNALVKITSTNTSETHTCIADEVQHAGTRSPISIAAEPLVPGSVGSVLKISKPNKSTSSTTNKSRSNKRYSNNAKYIGDCAEKQVLTYLKTAAGHSEFDVAENLRWVAQEGEKPGYDIEYTNSAGDLIGVEVKGSISKNFSNFELTANEWSAAKQFGDRYALVLVANVDKSPRFECFWNPAADSSFSAEPSSYTVKRLS